MGPSSVFLHILVVELTSFNLYWLLERRRKDSLETGGYQEREVGRALCSTLSDDRIRRLSCVECAKSYSTCKK